MIPDPLHPAVVHFPIVLMFLVPLVMLGALVAIRRGAAPRRVWSFAVAAAAVFSLSSWVAVQTGESEEDRVEDAVSHAALEAHEEPAERFVLLTGVLAVVALGGFAGGVVGRAARAVALIGSLGVLGAGVQVGHTGGELAYRHGAAAAYSEGMQTEALGGRSQDVDDD
jgi:hypothetical protein